MKLLDSVLDECKGNVQSKHYVQEVTQICATYQLSRSQVKKDAAIGRFLVQNPAAKHLWDMPKSRVEKIISLTVNGMVIVAPKAKEKKPSKLDLLQAENEKLKEELEKFRSALSKLQKESLDIAYYRDRDMKFQALMNYMDEKKQGNADIILATAIKKYNDFPPSSLR